MSILSDYRRQQEQHAAVWGSADFSRRFCCYAHIDPRTKEQLYIGQGVPGRALDLFSISRSHEHVAYMADLIFDHNVPLKEIVSLLRGGLAKNEAEVMESALLAEFLVTYGKLPRFNKVRAVPRGKGMSFRIRRTHTENGFIAVADASAPNVLSSVEKLTIAEALHTGRTITRAARILGIGRSTLYRKMQLFGITNYGRD